MYTRRLSQNIIVSPSNLKNAPKEIRKLPLIKYGGLLQQRISAIIQLNDQMRCFLKNRKIFKMLYEFSHSYPEKSLRIWIQQFECVFAQRVRRGQQMICLYSKWWEEKALRDFIKRFRVTVSRNGRDLIFGAVGVSVYNWNEHRIGDEEFQDHFDDIEYIHRLKDQTMCLPCEEGKQSNVNKNICKCGTGGVTSKSFDEWTPFIEKDDLIVWRRLHSEGLYEYKVYGSYYDVTAEDFLYVQVDSDYRKQWDTTAVKLEIGEKEVESNSDILYWEMQWPRLFVNRDYVFNRRYKIDTEANTMVIVNKTTEYPAFPKYPDRYRVEEYWSYMVIKPYTDMKKSGLEFSLTYFDNPGVNIPSTVTTWVAKSAMPDFLAKLRTASRNYKAYCLAKGTTKVCEEYQLEEKKKREEEEKNKLEYCSNELIDVTKFRGSLRRITQDEFFKESRKSLEKGIAATESSVQSSAKTTNESSTFWKYLHPLYYFT